jgi:hypothetical protein
LDIADSTINNISGYFKLVRHTPDALGWFKSNGKDHGDKYNDMAPVEWKRVMQRGAKAALKREREEMSASSEESDQPRPKKRKVRRARARRGPPLLRQTIKCSPR